MKKNLNPKTPLPGRFYALAATQAFASLNHELIIRFAELFIIAGWAITQPHDIIFIATLVFAVPYIIFGPLAGYVADRFSKSKVIIILKVIEPAILLVASHAFTTNNINLMFVVLFLFATHNAFFNPVKLSIIPEICPTPAISKANAWIQVTIFFFLMIGYCTASYLFTETSPTTIIVFIAVGVSVLGLISAIFIPETKSSSKDIPFPFEPVSGIIKNIILLSQRKSHLLASTTSCYFWVFGWLLNFNIFFYGRSYFTGIYDPIYVYILPVFIGLGILFGSLLSGRWSEGKIELGLVPLGGAGMAFFSICLFFSTGSYWFTAAFLFFSGLFGGVFIVPLLSYLEYHPEKNERGRILATTGVFNALGLAVGAVAFQYLVFHLKLPPEYIFLFMGIVTIFVIYIMILKIPRFIMRFAAWMLVHTFYRIRVVGIENVPYRGPALLTPNHVSFIDFLLVGITIQRFVKFVMLQAFFEIPIFKDLCKAYETIPINPQEGRASVTKSIQKSREKLLAGEVVCIFPEGKLTRDGEIDTFKPGMESLMEGLDCPIIPVYQHNIWGSIFSYEGAGIGKKWPKEIPHHVTIYYGTPLPPNTKAAEVERIVKQMEEEVKQGKI